MKKVLGFFLIIMFFASANAQQDLMLSQQFFSRLNFNPAATGNTDDVDLFLLGRWQWMGLDNSPKTGVLNASNYFERIRSGVGLTVSYDDLGIANRTMIAKAAYAYHINLNETLLLSMGISGGILYHYFDPTKHLPVDPEEIGSPSYPANIVTSIKPDVDFGMELSTPNLIVGGSITHLLNNEADVETSVPGRHYHLYTRGLIPLSQTLDFAPALVYMHRQRTDLLELNLMMFYNKMFWGGITYRPDLHDSFASNTLHFTVGLEYKKFRFGYSFEWGLGNISDLSANASEILLSYRIAKSTKNKYTRFIE
jgi:type IX secretion system PorP/SprF family membrane protein